MTRLESDPRFVSSTHEGLTFTILQFVVLLALPFLWNPYLSYWIHYNSRGCNPELPSKFLSKIFALTGGVLFLVIRIPYLARAYDISGGIPCDHNDKRPSEECIYARLHVTNIVLACAASGIFMYTSLLRLLAPWLANPSDLSRAKIRARLGDEGGDLDCGSSCLLCTSDIEPDSIRMSCIAAFNGVARILVLISLAIDVSSREGKEVTGFGIVGLFLCFCVGISFIWYTCIVHRGKHVVAHQEEAVPITSPEAHEGADVWKRAHLGTASVLWLSGCAFLLPVHFLRVGESY